MEDGLSKDGQALNIKQIDAAQMTSATDVLVQADKLFNTSRSLQQTAYNNFHAADDALTAWLGVVTGSLSAFFGKRWSAQWVQVGFINPSIGIPSTISDRAALALRMINFLSANPGYEASNQGVTAAKGTTLRGNASTTQGLATAADKDLSDQGTAREAAVADLASKMRLLIGLLSEILKTDDPRWLDFGLEMPAKLTTPAPPAGLAVAAAPTQGAMGAADPNTTTVLVTCDATPFATRYRFRMRMAGLLGSNYQLVASTTEPMAQINVPANATVEFIIQAVNGNRQSVASAAAVYQPVVKTAAAVSAVQIEEVAAPRSNGSNGHANGNRMPALNS